MEVFCLKNRIIATLKNIITQTFNKEQVSMLEQG